MPAAVDDFGRKTARAAAWAFLSSSGARVITLIGLSLLARLLAPREFGLLAFALTYIVYVDTIADLGSGAALVYWPDRRDEAAQVTFLISITAGLFWCSITFFAASWIASFFNAPNGANIVRALSFVFFVKYLGTTHDALMRKDLRFRDGAIPEIANAGVKMLVAVVLAWRGFGAWSLIWAHLAGLIAWTVLLWVMMPWRPSFTLPRDLVKPMLSYGRGIIFVNILSAVQKQTDLLMIARRLGMTPLGLYQLAGKIPEATVAMIYRVASDVLLPAFSRVSASGENPKHVYLAAARYVSSVTLPIAAGIAILAKPLVLMFFGPRWVEAAPLVSALSILSGVRSLGAHPGDVLKATGRVHVLAKIGFLRTSMIVISVVIASNYSALAVAVALLSVDTFATFISFSVTSRAIGITLGEVGKAFAPSVIAAGSMSVALLAWLRFGPHLSPAVIAVALSVGLGAIAYVVALRFADPRILGEARAAFFARSASRAQ